MASKGRGRGRGRGFGGGFNCTPEPFVLFPENVNLPDVKVDDIDADRKQLLRWSTRHQNYWKASPYFLEDKTSKESQKMHIARYSDKKKTMFTRDSLSQVLVLNKFAPELVQGTCRQMASQKNFDGTQSQRMELFEQLEKKDQGRENKGEEEKEDEENEDDENAEDEEGEEEEEFGDDDYNQNEYYDDDEDDYNPADDGDDEPTY